MSGAQTSAVPGFRRSRRKPGQNRLSLIEAGVIEFGLHGYAAAQTSAIARRAGVSQPNVYANFSSKGELFLSCVASLVPAMELVTTSGRGEALSDANARLLFQAVAAAGDTVLGADIRSVIAELRVVAARSPFAQPRLGYSAPQVTVVDSAAAVDAENNESLFSQVLLRGAALLARNPHDS